MRPCALQPSGAHAGDVEQLIERRKRALAFAHGDDALRYRPANARNPSERLRVGEVEIDDADGLPAVHSTPRSAVSGTAPPSRRRRRSTRDAVPGGYSAPERRGGAIHFGQGLRWPRYGMKQSERGERDAAGEQRVTKHAALFPPFETNGKG